MRVNRIEYAVRAMILVDVSLPLSLFSSSIVHQSRGAGTPILRIYAGETL